MCMGGGGGGDGGAAAREAERQRKQDEAIGAINKIFGQGEDPEAMQSKAAREQMYGALRGDVYALNQDKLNRDRQEAERRMKFFLASQGLSGGSNDADQYGEIQRLYDQGVLDIGNRADAAANDFRSNDERSRLNIINQIRSGMDANQATSAALNQLDSNARTTRDNAISATIDNLFANLGDIYSANQVARGRAAAQQQGAFNTGSFNVAPSYSGSTSKT